MLALDEGPPLQATAWAREAAEGLLRPRAAVSPKFLYDALGSRLFEAVTALDEYYLTRVEAALMRANGEAIGRAVHEALGTDLTLVDLGAGDCAKAAALFAVLAPRRYVAVDIAVDHLWPSLVALHRQHPAVEMLGLGLDFAAGLHLPPGAVAGRPLVFYPGSSIGNFDPADALRLLRQARAIGDGAALLIGVDRVKDPAVLEAAYDDALGVTAAFNLNLLRHLNRRLGTDFDPRQWRHVARFDAAASRVEMHLEAREALVVRWSGAERRFAAGERIHTENSYKWDPRAFEALLHDAGFGQVQQWTDERGWFSVMLASG